MQETPLSDMRIAQCVDVLSRFAKFHATAMSCILSDINNQSMNSMSFPKIFNILTVFFMSDQICEKVSREHAASL